MKTAATEMLGIEFPIFAFSHCRDVVAAVSKAGGLGVLAGGALRRGWLTRLGGLATVPVMIGLNSPEPVAISSSMMTMKQAV